MVDDKMNKKFDEFLNKLEIDTAKLPVEAVTVMHVGFNYLQTRKNGKGVDSE